jgi:tRNA-binding protein
MIRKERRRIPLVMDDIVAAFAALDIRTGTIVEASPLEGARKPAFRLRIDFGALGARTSTAQLSERYSPASLVGKQVLAVVNLPVKRIAGVASEVLTLGVADERGAVVLVAPDSRVPDGSRLY